MKRILLAYDGGEPSVHAAGHAGDLAKHFGVPVLVLVVGELIESGYGSQVPVVAAEEYDGMAESGQKLVAKAGVEAERRVAWGAPAHTIVQEAKESGCDLIVLGHHGGGLRSLLLGSVARQVIDEAECSVLVVR